MSAKNKKKKVNVLIIGSGGREHAIGWKLKKSKRCGTLHFAPGNGGTAVLGKNVNTINPDRVDTKTVDDIDYYCRQNDVDLVVIGPEDPLSQGLADRLAKEGRMIFGPVAAAAKLEGDKAFAKQLMKAVSIPTADARVFKEYSVAANYVQSRETPVVVKAAGLAKGKGVIVCDDNDQALDALAQCMKNKSFGDAGDTVIVEERLSGQEVSILALVDGRNIYVLDPSQDHKQANEGDTGPNTGGMGAYCPTPLVNEKLMQTIEREILVPTVDALRRDGIEYKGVLYAGLMLTAGGPKVLEYNCRFGDPETQPLMMRLKGDLLEIMIATAQGTLDEIDLSWDSRCCCCVVMASGGYPGRYNANKTIRGIDDAESDPDVKVFHAGTRKTRDEFVTSGGRVLNVCAMGKDLKEAQEKANAACAKIKFDGAWYRKDIGWRVM
ncbi:Phosphoribosylamine--glycine ligase [Poriferisphaera corsica]|uniref:Phosphoribosylamine--glycine ligase n=1 Tax=Poriferisphaera corsica TaxID=2528020 RepID=A0A517YX46_9BACT|nr:phosphoribosylamine--glycine ligase [Poriferisphaera corsica]QDU34786.1 Phosphoribosylamine--glycine ligase [Poriferisphaera corsica]